MKSKNSHYQMPEYDKIVPYCGGKKKEKRKKKRLAKKGAEQIQPKNTYQGHHIFLIRVTCILI